MNKNKKIDYYDYYKFYDEFYDNIKYLYKTLPKITRDKVKIEEFMFFCYIGYMLNKLSYIHI